jgi:mRNA-degrading endonuclease RelE of RelBE toxin-antitoxin system
VKKKLFNEIRRLNEFDREFKKLLKRFKTLDEDLNNFIKFQLNLTHKLNIIEKKNIVRISNLNIDSPKIYKARRFACKSLKGKGARSGMRIIYAYYEEDDIIEFIEIYHKAQKANEDRDRIIEHYKN